MPTPRHLLTVWNPSYTSNAMEAYLGVLLDRIRDWREDFGDEDDIYVWWGKIRSENRQQGMARDAELRAFDAALDDLSIMETQVYLTDYRSFYAGVVDLPLIVTRPDGRHFFLPVDFYLLPPG